jgi:prophage regulatory protein
MTKHQRPSRVARDAAKLTRTAIAPQGLPQLAATIIRRPGVTAQTGEPRSTLYDRIAKGLMTPPVKLGPRSVGWPAAEVEAINRARIAGATPDELRALVHRLVGARSRMTVEA